MSSNWRKVKLALGLDHLSVSLPQGATPGDDLPSPAEKCPDAASLSPVHSRSNWISFGSARLSKSFSSSSKKTCSICLGTMKRGDGSAIFTAECSHSFHFNCIASNVKHGNQICPICRAKWKEIPWQCPTVQPPERVRINHVAWSQNDTTETAVNQLPSPRPNSIRHVGQLEPAVFNDDEALSYNTENAEKVSANRCPPDIESLTALIVKMYPEVQAVPQFSAYDNFNVLIHLKAPVTFLKHNHRCNGSNMSQICQTSRAPVDLVTVLDTSGSMAGTKLALLKQGMGFLIQNLGPNDRLAVIAFSSTARRLFPLRCMSETGRQHALQAINSLAANGGTNIAEGLRKGVKVMEDRREKNPVASILLLSDGQDTYSVNRSSQSTPNNELPLPTTVHEKESSGFKIPVHAFGFGTDHDASSMHFISETSGGTFSFIETEGMIQDAFAQCIGGLLSVVVKELRLTIESVHPSIRLGSLKSGSYSNQLMPDGKTALVEVGDLYADEERDFLVSLNVPNELLNKETSLLKVRSVYTNPLTEHAITLDSEEVKIKRTEIAGQEIVLVEVDRQKNRLSAAEAMAEARATAEQGDLAGAVSILESCRKVLSQTVSAKYNDHLCIALDAELKEMQERMASKHVYEASGRAYILSGMSSHSWQRATARGDSTDNSSLIQAYKTESMTEMLSRSQATRVGSPSAHRLRQPKPR